MREPQQHARALLVAPSADRWPCFLAAAVGRGPARAFADGAPGALPHVCQWRSHPPATTWGNPCTLSHRVIATGSRRRRCASRPAPLGGAAYRRAALVRAPTCDTLSTRGGVERA